MKKLSVSGIIFFMLFVGKSYGADYEIIIEGNKCIKCPDDLKQIVESYTPPKVSMLISGEIYTPPPPVTVIEVINHNQVYAPPVFVNVNVDNRSTESGYQRTFRRWNR